jgi:hypothetical protein
MFGVGRNQKTKTRRKRAIQEMAVTVLVMAAVV